MKKTLQNLLAEGKTERVIAEAWFQQAEALLLELVRDGPQYAEFQKSLGIVQRALAGL